MTWRAVLVFDSLPAHSGLPAGYTVGGITASFFSTGQGFSIQPADTMGFTPVGFGGNCVDPNSVFASDLLIGFSQRHSPSARSNPSTASSFTTTPAHRPARIAACEKIERCVARRSRSVLQAAKHTPSDVKDSHTDIARRERAGLHSGEAQV